MIDLRQERPVTAQQIADEWGVTVATVWAWFRRGLEYVEAPSHGPKGRRVRRTTREAVARFMRQSDTHGKPQIAGVLRELREVHGM